jgi:3-vinyl bacteriochlorophyllide hydratase
MKHRMPWLSSAADDDPSTVLEREKSPDARQKPSTISHHSDQWLSINLYNSCRGQLTGSFDPVVRAAASLPDRRLPPRRAVAPLYTAEQRVRRDKSPWTVVQAALAPLQFVIFLISFCLVIRYLTTGVGLAQATESVVIKTIALYAIMITGSIWERDVFGRYLFARPFFWEDVFSLLVLALHTAYLGALVSGALAPRDQMLLALAAYATYVINATQFVLKLHAARRAPSTESMESMGLAS